MYIDEQNKFVKETTTHATESTNEYIANETHIAADKSNNENEIHKRGRKWIKDYTFGPKMLGSWTGEYKTVAVWKPVLEKLKL